MKAQKAAKILKKQLLFKLRKLRTVKKVNKRVKMKYLMTNLK